MNKKLKNAQELESLFDYVFLYYIYDLRNEIFGVNKGPSNDWFSETVCKAKTDLLNNYPNITDKLYSIVKDLTDSTEIRKIIIKELDVYYKKKKINADFV